MVVTLSLSHTHKHWHTLALLHLLTTKAPYNKHIRKPMHIKLVFCRGLILVPLTCLCFFSFGSRKKLYPLRIVLSLTLLNMIWPWSGAYYKKDQTLFGGTCIRSWKYSIPSPSYKVAACCFLCQTSLN